MAIIYAYKDRGMTKDFKALKGNGDVIVPGKNDKIRAIIGREGKLGVNNADAQLVVDSDEATVAGSSFTKNGGGSGFNRLRLDATDLSFPAGTYTLFFDLLDNADSQEWKNVDRQCFHLENT